MHKKKLTINLAVGAALVAALVGGIQLWQQTDRSGQLHAQQSAELEPTDPELLVGAERLSDAFRSAARRLRSSVVTITSSVEVSGRSAGGLGVAPGLIPDELLEELLGRSQRPAPPEENRPKRKVQTGIGSGVIVSADGFVLTNNHVVRNADELTVELTDGRAFQATVVGADEKSDVAVLKIDAQGLVPARLGDSAQLEVGDWVLAVGSPFGLDQTVTAGIISATNRQTGIIESGYEDFLQTDAAINPGNSGGPLVNLRGEVIGINTAISRQGQGIGFAIPADMARDILPQLMTSGRVVRSFIGLYPKPVPPEIATRLGLAVGKGALIDRVVRGGPAHQAGLREDDIVLRFDGQEIDPTKNLRWLAQTAGVGRKIELEVLRDGQPMTLSLVTEAMPE